MNLVIDASVACKWFFEEDLSSEARAFLKALPQWFESLAPSARLHEAAFEMACVLKHPVYHCQYLALAQEEGTRLVTADRVFVERTRRSRWKDRIESLSGD